MSASLSADEARSLVKALKAPERAQLREAGQRKMAELKALKASVEEAHAAAKLRHRHSYPSTTIAQPTGDSSSQQRASTGGGSGVLPHSCSSNSSSNSSSSAVLAAASAVAAGAAALAREAGAAAGPMDAAGSSGAVVGQAAAAVPNRSPGEQAVLQQQQQQAPQTAVQQQQQQQDGAGQQLVEPVSVPFQDPMVDVLLQQVEALMSEKQQLAAKCCGLQRANEQLVELVTTLEVTLESAVDAQEEQQQQQQSGKLRPLSLPPLSKDEGEEEEDALGLDADAAAAEGAACVGDDGCDPMLSQSEGHSPTFTQESVGGCGGECDSGQGEGEPMLTEHEVVAAAVQPHMTQPAPPATGVVQAAESVPSPAAAAASPAAAPASPAAGVAADTLMAHQKHMRVAEWLAHRVHEGRSNDAPAAAVGAGVGAQSWQKWQEQLPLAEAMSSGSSSTLTIALAEP